VIQSKRPCRPSDLRFNTRTNTQSLMQSPQRPMPVLVDLEDLRQVSQNSPRDRLYPEVSPPSISTAISRRNRFGPFVHTK
jgi:hypothetical protein